MIDTTRHRLQRRHCVPTNLNIHVRRTRHQHAQEDFVLREEFGVVDRGVLRFMVPRRATCGARLRGVNTIPEDELFLVDGVGGGVGALVGVDVVGEEVAPAVVRHVVDVGLGAFGDAGGADGADVVGFAVVVPGDDLGGVC